MVHTRDTRLNPTWSFTQGEQSLAQETHDVNKIPSPKTHVHWNALGGNQHLCLGEKTSGKPIEDAGDD